MTNLDLQHRRLINQHLLGAPLEKPIDVVRWLGAVQAQDYGGAKWALGLRLPGINNADIEREFTAGNILRTHVMRPTWHFVTAKDIRWMVALTGPRVITKMSHAYRITELDSSVFVKSNDALIKGLRGGKQLTRPELVAILKQVGIPTEDMLRTNHILMRAELDGIMVSGALRGKQHTYTLIDERAPQAIALTKDESMAELARRFFLSHGPATLKDYVWWSGLTVTEAKAGLEMVKSQLDHEVADDETFWFAESTPIQHNTAPSAYLMPNYDEYIVAYTDRHFVFDQQHADKLDARGNILFNNTIVINGRIVGTWKRTLKKGSVVIAATPFAPITETELFAAAAERYGEFLNLSTVLS